MGGQCLFKVHRSVSIALLIKFEHATVQVEVLNIEDVLVVVRKGEDSL